MNDTEKAKEIASLLWNGDEMNGGLIRGIAIMSAMQMAAWKEKQLITWLENNASNYVVCNDFAEFSHYATKTMIEDLKKYLTLKKN